MKFQAFFQIKIIGPQAASGVAKAQLLLTFDLLETRCMSGIF